MVEKPKKGTAPSNLFINGRYILQPEIFDILENQERGAGNEIQLTDGMLKLPAREQKFHGFHYRGRTFDCGSPEGFVEANVAFARVAARHAQQDRRQRGWSPISARSAAARRRDAPYRCNLRPRNTLSAL